MFYSKPVDKKENKNEVIKNNYWLLLYRKSNREFLYFGQNGDKHNSRLIKIFQVKSGNGEISPTPLPKYLGREYWLIIKKEDSSENLETAPYFLTLDIPVSEVFPYGPNPYPECYGNCDWAFPGYFGLHGVNGNVEKLSEEDPGSSGCIRHKDKDIVFLYNLLDPEKTSVRYYIEDI